MVSAFIVALLPFIHLEPRLQPTPKSDVMDCCIVRLPNSSRTKFTIETSKGTFRTLQIYSNATTIYLGKYLYNLGFSLLIYLLSFSLYGFLIKWSIISYPAFLYVMVFGTMGLSSVCTLIAAIVSQADRQGAIFSVLSIPLFIPFILLLSRLTKKAFVDGMTGWWNSEVAALIGFVGVTSVAGWLLFDFIWEVD